MYGVRPLKVGQSSLVPGTMSHIYRKMFCHIPGETGPRELKVSIPLYVELSSINQRVKLNIKLYTFRCFSCLDKRFARLFRC